MSMSIISCGYDTYDQLLIMCICISIKYDIHSLSVRQLFENGGVPAAGEAGWVQAGRSGGRKKRGRQRHPREIRMQAYLFFL